VICQAAPARHSHHARGCPFQTIAPSELALCRFDAAISTSQFDLAVRRPEAYRLCLQITTTSTEGALCLLPFPGHCF
jgi:hypothetical protein